MSRLWNLIIVLGPTDPLKCGLCATLINRVFAQQIADRPKYFLNGDL